jgi:hypothetical protein
MKAALTSLLAATLLAAVAHAQPQISYIIPDIGAPGMNTYVEIIAPVTESGTFGGNGQYINNGSETISVLPANAADNSRILVGPLVVSWDARLISTQVFVKPGAATGTVPLRVTVNGQSSTVNFEIVTPITLGAGGTLSASGALGSGGIYGTRSKRGAMIHDKMILSGGTYTISTTDPDPATPGNQGYLPFILISKGIVALTNGATINANSTATDGAPGGGGGGGSYCDIAGSGSNGGAGFTSGGAGGRNGSGLASNIYQSLSPSTGATGTSLNGVAPGGHTDCSKYEGAGGGTGHPFGKSGVGPCYPTQGQYGGGSPADQTSGGGGGGYGIAGANGANAGASANGGKQHGNLQGVPVAGGSGGASGNPQASFPGGCSGAGGGGGGALVIYSMDILNNTTLAARGGAGGGKSGSGSGAGGGGGAGGYIALGAKIPFGSGGSGDVSGGAGGNSGGGAGGAGRGRYDGFLLQPPTYTGVATPYAGPTIDTLSYVQTRTFTLQGTKGNDAIQVFMRSETGPWIQQPAPTVAGRVWTLPITVPTSGYYYFCAMQVVNSPSTTQFLNEPGFVMSQASANMIKVDLVPRINVDSMAVTFNNIVCQSEVIDSVVIWNSGDDTLRVTPSLFSGTNFQILPPYNAGPIGIAPRPGDTLIVMKIRFKPTTPGAKVDTLILQNNDPRPGRAPLKIVLKGTKANLVQGLTTSVIDFGPICKDSSSQVLSAILNHTGDVSGSIKSITRLGTGTAAFTVTDPLTGQLPVTLAAGTSSRAIKVRFTPPAAGAFADSFRVVVGPCDTAFVFTVRGVGVVNTVEVTPNPLNFGDVRVTQQLGSTVTVKNTGTASGTITGAFIKPAGAPFTAPVSLIGTTLAPGQSGTGTATFAPTATGAASAQLCVVFGSTCPDTVCIDLTGRGVTSLLALSRKNLILTADTCALTPGAVADTFQLYNRGTAPVRVDAVSAVNGVVTVTSLPALASDLNAGDSITFTVRWSPGTTGTDQIRITTQADEPTQKTLTVDVALRREIVALDAAETSGAALPANIDFGSVFACTGAKGYTFILRNRGTLTENVTGAFVNGTSFSATPGAPYTIPAGNDQSITITFAPSANGIFSDTLVLREGTCGREIRIPMSGARYGVTFSAAGFSFGNSNVGVTRGGTVTLTNTSSDVKLVLNDVSIQPTGSAFSVVQPLSLPRDVAPGEVAAIDVSFLPTAQTAYSAQICFHITSPCDTTICVPLDGAGIQSNVLVRQSSLNFGTQYICHDTTIKVFVINTGNAPLNVTGLAVTGGDAQAFTQTPAVTTPIAVAPNDSIEVDILFTPANATSDGLKQSTLEIRTDDPAQPVIRVALVGERRRQALATPRQIDFGTVVVGDAPVDTLTLENRTNAPMLITALDIAAPFSVVGPTPPLTIAAGDSVHVIIRFTPADSGAFTGTLIARQGSPCPDSTLIPVAGRGKIVQVGGAEIEISSDLEGEPGQHVAIPIVLRTGRLLAESEAKTFRATLRFDATLLLPTGARGKGQPFAKAVAGNGSGKIISSKIEGRQRVVTVEIKNDPIPAAPDTLGFVDATVLLGDTLSTPIAIDTLFWTDGEVNSATTDGFFTLKGYCTIGGNRLVTTGGTFGIKAVTPNPFNPSTEIYFETLEQGVTSLVIYDLYGNIVTRLVDRETLPAAMHMRAWSAGNIPSGVYIAVLTSPTERSIQQLVLAK